MANQLVIDVLQSHALGYSLRLVVTAAAFVAAWGGVFAQHEIAATNTASQLTEQRQQATAELEREIQVIESREGTNSAQLIDPLSSLGSIYQEAGEHLLAAAAIERARHIVRVNAGLYSLEQAPLLRQLIQSADAVGAIETAWDLEQELLGVAERHPGTLQTAQILHETADRRVEMLRRYSELAAVLRCNHDPRSTASGAMKICTTDSMALAWDAQRYYSQSINILIENEAFASDELPVLVRKLVRTMYTYYGPLGYQLGDRSLRYLLAYQAKKQEPLLARVDTLVQIADWGLLHSSNRKSDEQVLALYQQAYDLLEAQPTGEAARKQFFAPATPVVLPAFLNNRLASEQTPATTGYVDIAFEITKYGDARDVEILDSTSNATRADKQRLAQLVLRSRFRPRVTNGLLIDSEQIVVRYYLGE